MTCSFRLKRSYRYLSVALLAVSIAMLGAGARVLLAAVAQGKAPLLPLLFASLVLLGIPVFFVTLGGYLLALTSRHSHAVPFLDESEQNMFGADIFLAESLGLLIG